MSISALDMIPIIVKMLTRDMVTTTAIQLQYSCTYL